MLVFLFENLDKKIIYCLWYEKIECGWWLLINYNNIYLNYV